MCRLGDNPNPAIVQMVTHAADHAMQELTTGQVHISRTSSVINLLEGVVVLIAFLHGVLWLRRTVGVAWLLRFVGRSNPTCPFSNLQFVVKQCLHASPDKLLSIAVSRGVTVQQLHVWIEAWKTLYASLQLLSIRIHPILIPSDPTIHAPPSTSVCDDVLPDPLSRRRFAQHSFHKTSVFDDVVAQPHRRRVAQQVHQRFNMLPPPPGLEQVRDYAAGSNQRHRFNAAVRPSDSSSWRQAC